MKKLALILAVVSMAFIASTASAQCQQGRVDQTNLLLGQQLLSGNAASASTGSLACDTCQKNTQSLTTRSFSAPAPAQAPLQMFTMPAPQQTTKRYVLTEEQTSQPAPQVLYMTSVAQPGASTSASSSAGSSAASASSSVADTALPFIALPPQQSLTQNSTACGGGCGRVGLLRRAFSGFGGRRGTTTSRSVSRSFTQTTVN